MDQVRESAETFICRNAPVPDLSTGLRFPRNIILRALFAPDMKWRLVEEFGPDCYETQEDGRLLLTRDYSDTENLTMWMLTFGDKAEVLEPAEVREKLKNMAESMSRIYGGNENESN